MMFDKMVVSNVYIMFAPYSALLSVALADTRWSRLLNQP